jgi:DNA-binding GntR family transcriptional regulator
VQHIFVCNISLADRKRRWFMETAMTAEAPDCTLALQARSIAGRLADGSRPTAGSLHAGSLHEEILARLRDYIVEENLLDGARIPERQLCDLFKISRTPLREALKVLAAERLIDLLPNRGARIRPLSLHDVSELFDVMGGLEALAGRLACEQIEDQAILEIEKLHREMYGFYLNRDIHEYFRCNQLIHERIVLAARNGTLSSTYASFATRIRRVRYCANLAHHRDRWGEAMREHEGILDALRRRDGSELSDILFRHLRNKKEAAVAYLEQAAQKSSLPAPFRSADTSS